MNPQPAACLPLGKPAFTLRQGQYLAFIHAYRQLLGQSPAEADFQRHFRVTPPSVHQMILTLERAGLIRRKPGVARSIELLIDPQHLPPMPPADPLSVKTSVRRY
jgi:DNA-binding MarR family transcriptional regulator